MKVILYPKKKPDDWKFMEKSQEILENRPETWKAYPMTEEGCMGIIKMEYEEFEKATGRYEKMHELVHLATACLAYWRRLHANNK